MINSLICLSIAAFMNAVMDKVSHHYHKSIFKNYNSQFWNPSISWKNKYNDGKPSNGRRKWFWNINYPVQLTDAWHLFKTLMIIFICLSISFALFSDVIVYLGLLDNILNLLFLIGIYGTVWNCTFSLFYKHLLEQK